MRSFAVSHTLPFSFVALLGCFGLGCQSLDEGQADHVNPLDMQVPVDAPNPRSGADTAEVVTRGWLPEFPGGFENACGLILVPLDGAADGFYDYDSHVTYVKSFDLGGVLEAQLVITAPSDAPAAYDLGPASPVSVLLINPFAIGVDSYEASAGTVAIAGDLSSGAGIFTFSNLTMQLVGNDEAIGNSDCYEFFDFALDGYSEVPASWTCPSNAYSDELCHCGCGAPDPICGDTVRSCEECNAPGSCAEARRGCETIRERDLARCEWSKVDDFLPNPGGKPTTLTWAADIEPLFATVCDNCHPDVFDPDVMDYSVLIDGGWVVPGSAKASPLWTDRIDAPVPADIMPPGGFGDDESKFLIRDWIDQGASEF